MTKDGKLHGYVAIVHRCAGSYLRKIQQQSFNQLFAICYYCYIVEHFADPRRNGSLRQARDYSVGELNPGRWRQRRVCYHSTTRYTSQYRVNIVSLLSFIDACVCVCVCVCACVRACVRAVDADDERSEQSAPRSPRLAAANWSTTSRRTRRLQPSSNSSSGRTAGRQLYHPMTPIADVDSTMAMSREVTSFNQMTVLPSIIHKLEAERHEEGMPKNTRTHARTQTHACAYARTHTAHILLVIFLTMPS